MSHALLAGLLDKAAGDATALWGNIRAYLHTTTMDAARARHIVHAAKSFSFEELKHCIKKFAITLLTQEDRRFPSVIGVENPPVIIYLRGTVSALEREAIAIVGARKMTPYGEGAVHMLVPHIVGSGCATVSGMARGIDGEVHRQTLAHSGVTLAVVGCGVDKIYPYEHRELVSQMIKGGGAYISEFPLGTSPKPWHFPQRNRLIARWAKAVIVVEAALGSGSLHTAEWALDYGTPLYVVPGSIFSPQSSGTLTFAKMPEVRILSEPKDLLECAVQRSLEIPFVKEIPGKTSRLLALLQDDPMDPSEIAQALGYTLQDCLVELSQLHLYRLIRPFAGGWVRDRSNS